MMFIPPPSQYVIPELAAALRNVAAEAEHLKNLHPVQLAIIYEQQWFRLFVPKEYKGAGLSLPAALQLEEALAWADGSVGWTVTLCAGAGWFVGFLDPQIAALIFNEKNVCIAGSGKVSGIAKKNKGGYEITGSWDYASGANHATAFTANCMIEENGTHLTDPGGSPLIQAFVFLPHEVTVKENWKRIGMIATGSHSFAVDAITVNTNRAFIIDKQHAVLKDPIYQYPFLQFAETTLAVNSSGMAFHFLELCTAILKKTNNHMQMEAENAIAALERIRQEFYTDTIASWEQCCSNAAIDPALLQQVSDISMQLAISSRKIVDEYYPYCGMQAADPGTEINRVWRNLHTASQHSLFNR
jgi:alkylation response protein AidB-like acyl-CoA dehydrogenase